MDLSNKSFINMTESLLIEHYMQAYSKDTNGYSIFGIPSHEISVTPQGYSDRAFIKRLDLNKRHYEVITKERTVQEASETAERWNEAYQQFLDSKELADLMRLNYGSWLSVHSGLRKERYHGFYRILSEDGIKIIEIGIDGYPYNGLGEMFNRIIDRYFGDLLDDLPESETRFWEISTIKTK